MPTGHKRPPRRRARRDGNVVHVRYCEPVAREICERIAAGESWRGICGTGRLPSYGVLVSWRDRYPVFAEALAQAREVAREIARHGAVQGEWPDIFNRLQLDEMSEEDRPKATGRPRKRMGPNGRVVYVRYSKRLAEQICERLAAGECWWRLANTAGMPSYRTFHNWQKKHPEFAAAVGEARRIGAEARFEKALAVAEESTPATVQSDKLRVATLLHHAERLDPERFGRGGSAGRGEGGGFVQRIIVRRFERAVDENGREYVRAIDSVQERERGR